MFTKIVFTIIATLTAAAIAFAQPKPKLSDYPACPTYVSQKSLEASSAALIKSEEGQFITVPLNYADPAQGTTRIYFHFAQKFQPERPTLALFTGGPGQHSHLQSSDQIRFFGKLGFNFLLFDQRGIALSRMATEDQARDARNFSSENTARDLKMILDHLKIEKASLYGISYGTVPATIFGSLFPERTTAVILEGVVFDGWTDTMRSRNVARQIEDTFKKLPQPLQDRIHQLIAEKKLSETWYPAQMSRLLMSHGLQLQKTFQKHLQKYLDPSQFKNESQLSQLIDMEMSFAALDQKSTAESDRQNAWAKLESGTGPCDFIWNSSDLNHLLMLKEFNAHHPEATLTLALRKTKVEAVPGINYAPHLAKFTNLEGSFSSYSAAQYPLKVPVVYFQGTADSATPSPGAARHFRESAKSQAQLIFMNGRAHLPVHQLIAQTSSSHPDWTSFKKAFASLVNGEQMTCETVAFFNKLDPELKLSIALRSSDGQVQGLRCP